MTYEYLFQVLCLLSIVAVPFALSKKSIKRTTRLALAMCPVVFGVIGALVTHDATSVFIALIGLWTVFFVMAKRKEEKHD